MEIFTGIPIQFFEFYDGQSPVINWINSLPVVDQNRVDVELKKVALGFKFRRGNFRKIAGYPGLWEIRCSLSNNQAARLLFCINNNKLLILHGFLKRSQKTPLNALSIAKKRMRGLI